MAKAERPDGRGRGESLAIQVRREALATSTVVEGIGADSWHRLPRPEVWSVGKEAEHVGDALGYHIWIIRLTIGETVRSRRPSLERARMTTELSPAEAADRIRRVADEGARLIAGLTDDQLDRSTRPPRARNSVLAETIESVLVGHLGGHRASMLAKLRDLE